MVKLMLEMKETSIK